VHAPLFVGRKRAQAEGFELIEGSCFAASPAGTTNRADYEFMRDEILDQLKAALPVDGLLLGLHGAMVAHGYDDVEGDIIERAAAIVGPEVRDRRRARSALPSHTEARVEGRHHRALQGIPAHRRGRARRGRARPRARDACAAKVKPVMSVYDCRQIQSYPTTIQPMRGLVDRIMAMEGKDGILSVSIAHCFPYGDVAEIGTRVLVIADGDKKKADALATSLGEELVSLRGKTRPPYVDIKTGVSDGVAVQRPAGGDGRSGRQCRWRRAVGQHRHPQALIETKVENACIGPIWDPIAVRICFDAGSARSSTCASAARSP
jgi:microcystin degradation protein MlrC